MEHSRKIPRSIGSMKQPLFLKAVFPIISICGGFLSISSVSAESVFKPILFELARFIPNVELPTWFNYGAGGRLQPGRRVGPIDPIDVIRINGYTGEKHFAETEDGYILELHRLRKDESPYLPVLLLHGNFQSSADWMFNSPANNSLAFILWNMGFDVWLGNHRGNTYSKRHKKYALNSNDFWDFSLHEMGKYDMPGMIDYVLQKTGKPKVHYLCFSYSTAALTSGLTIRPEYNEKLATGILMGPAVFTANFLNGMVYYLAWHGVIIDYVLNLFGALPIMPHFLSEILTSVIPAFCSPRVDKIGICRNVLTLLFGDDGDLITRDQIPLIMSTVPSASGLKQWNHIVQMAKHLQFAQYNYGSIRNMEIYGSEKPPKYNLTKITAPISLFVGKNDNAAHREDAKFLAKKLPNLVEYYEAPYEKFIHVDFTYGKGLVVEQVYKRAIETMKRMERKLNMS